MERARKSVFVALIRGINVGGKKIVRMNELTGIFEGLGFAEVKTYIQSGNVVFKSNPATIQGLEKMIRGAIKEATGLDVGVAVLSLKELGELVKRNPFSRTGAQKGQRVYITLLMQSLSREGLSKLTAFKASSAQLHTKDGLELDGRAIYVLCHDGWSASPFNGSAIEKITKVETTTRNLATIDRLWEIGNSLT